MRYVRIWTSMLFVLIVAAACADGPTTPDSARAENAPPSRDDIIRLGPVIVVGQCDPWTDANWCQEDDGGQCMTSTPADPSDNYTVSSCPGTGPGDPGTGPGGPGGSNGDSGSDPDPSKPTNSDADLVEQDSMPDCANSATWTAVWHGPYCSGTAPAGADRTAFDAALNTMAGKGGFCAELANFGRLLLGQNRVRYYNGTGSTLRSWGGPAIGVVMDRGFLSNPAPYHHTFALAHELEHAYSGYRHTSGDTDANGVHHTPNDMACS
jgi:hypothetical protein